MYLKNETYRNDLENAFRGAVNIEKLYRKGILITGATGLIGSFMTDLLLYANQTADAQIDIYILARNGERIRERFASGLKEQRFHYVVQDVVNPPELNAVVDYIIHAAGDGFPSAFREHPVETMTPALFGTYHLLRYAKENNIKKFLYVSSGEVYGNPSEPGHAIREWDGGYIDTMNVRSCYPVAKRCAETLCVSFGAQYHIPVVVARPGHTYGACTSTHDNRATAQFLKNAVAGENITLYSTGGAMRNYTYVADCVSGILTVLLNGLDGEAYNIANADSMVTIAEFARILAEKSGVNCAVREPGETERKECTPVEYAVLDASKLERLGWKGQYDIYGGIENMLRTGKQMKRKGKNSHA